MKHSSTTGHSTVKNASKGKWSDSVNLSPPGHVNVNTLEQGDHFKTESGMIGVFLGSNDSYATVLIYAVPKFHNSTEKFAEELSRFYLGKKDIGCETQVTYQKGAYDVKETNPNIRIQSEEHNNG